MVSKWARNHSDLMGAGIFGVFFALPAAIVLFSINLYIGLFGSAFIWAFTSIFAKLAYNADRELAPLRMRCR